MLWSNIYCFFSVLVLFFFLVDLEDGMDDYKLFFFIIIAEDDDDM